jgi:hypothetical protein
MLKRIAMCFVVAVGLSACNQNTPIDTNTQKPQPQLSAPNLQAQYLNTTCYEFSYGYQSYSCSSDQRTAVEVAGYLFYEAGRNNQFSFSDFNTTVGATYINGRWEISAFDGSTLKAKTAFRQTAIAKGYHWNEPSGGLHAEQVLYRLYSGSLYGIGISNYNGPCSTCRSEVANYQNWVAWYPNWKWSTLTNR